MPRTESQTRADLMDKHLALVEAIKTSKDAAQGREQARQYCNKIQKQLGGKLPFCWNEISNQWSFL